MQYMRDAFFECILSRMRTNNNIFFLTADVGSPVLDKMKHDYGNRFLNVGIAEQNMINLAAGLAMEEFEVYAYGIASFFLRCVDQIRSSLLLTNQMRPINVNLLATGKGVSYETAGPAHHCLEDLPLFSIFPGINIFVPSDSIMAEKMAKELSPQIGVKYFCFEGKKSTNFYMSQHDINLIDGFTEYSKGKDICIISQGSILNLTLEAISKLSQAKIGIIDVFSSKNRINSKKLLHVLSGYHTLIIIEEGYREKGFLIRTIEDILTNATFKRVIYNLGFDDKYVFDVGTREMHYQNNNITISSILRTIEHVAKG